MFACTELVSWTLYMYGRARPGSSSEKMDLGFCTSYEDEASADGEQHQAYKPSSELEGIAPKGCQTTCVKYPR